MADPVHPLPPSCIPADMLSLPANGCRVCVAGLVQVRQRPGTAKGVVFITLEDETGCSNVIVWKRVFERFRRTIMTARLMRVTGRVQREGDVVHVIADTVEDISDMLDDVFSGAAGTDEADSS